LLPRETAFQFVVEDDEALRGHVSLGGRAIFLVLCAEAAFLRLDLEDADYHLCCRFIWDCVCFLETLQLPASSFEEHVQTREGDSGLLVKSENDAPNKDFWMFMTNVAGWFAVIAANTQGDYSYFGDVEDPDSINRVFFAWKTSQPRFLDRKYIADALRFVTTRFPPVTNGLTKIDYGAVRVSFLEFLAVAA
jgi:hypothetical protein